MKQSYRSTQVSERAAARTDTRELQLACSADSINTQHSLRGSCSSQWSAAYLQALWPPAADCSSLRRQETASPTSVQSATPEQQARGGLLQHRRWC